MHCKASQDNIGKQCINDDGVLAVGDEDIKQFEKAFEHEVCM